MTDKRDDILKATLQLISQQGFHGTPMSMVAKQAGVGAGTIYRYFESKETLINELFLEVKRDISQAMLEGVNLQASVEEIFRQVWLNTFNYCLRNPAEMLFLEQFHNSPFQTPESEAAMLEYLAPLVSVIQAAVESGQIKALPFQMLTIFAYDVTVAHAKRHLSGVLEMDQANLELAVQACWDAIRTN